MTQADGKQSTSTKPCARGDGGWVAGLDRRARAMLGEMGLSLTWLASTQPTSNGAGAVPSLGAGAASGPLDQGGMGTPGQAPATGVLARRDPAEGAGPTPAPWAASAQPSGTGPDKAAAPVSASAGAAQLTALADLDALQLRQAAAKCSACALCKGRQQVVLGTAHGADWMLVGGPPEGAEDAAGQPFMGPAGDLVDAFLRASGRRRNGLGVEPCAGTDPGTLGTDRAGLAHLAHVTLCRPAGGRAPRAEELAACRHYLVRQVALVQPRVILALGPHAAQSLLDSPLPLGRLRGAVHRFQGVPVVVSYAPQYLLRSPVDKARAWADFCLAQSL